MQEKAGSDKAQALKEYAALARKRELFPARLEIIQKLVVQILMTKAQNETTIAQAAEELLGQFLTVPFTAAINLREKETDATTFEPKRFSFENCEGPNGLEEEEIFSRYLSEPLRLLSLVLGDTSTEGDIQSLLNPLVINSIAGISLINSREVRIFSPLHLYFEKIQQNSQISFPFLPIIFKIDSVYGGLFSSTHSLPFVRHTSSGYLSVMSCLFSNQSLL